MKVLNLEFHQIPKLLIILIACPKHLIAGPKGPFPDAKIYEELEVSSQYVEYSNDPDVWSDMQDLLIHTQHEKFGLLCVTGTFLLYEHPNFQAKNENGIKLLSGIDACTEILGVGSIQVVTSFTQIFSPSITFFRQNILRGTAFPITKPMENFRSAFEGNVESLVIHGKRPWTAVSVTGVTYCLMPKFDSSYKFPICIIPDVQNTEVGMDMEWASVRPTCDKPKSTIYVTNCFEFGKGQSDGIDIDNGNEDTRIAPQTVIKLTDCNNEELVTLLDLRMNNDFSSVYQMRFPKDKSLYWRTELLDSAFDITVEVCPISAPWFLGMIRETFIYLAETNVWSGGAGEPKNQTNVLQSIITQVDECLLRIQVSEIFDSITDTVSQYYSLLASGKNLSSEANINKEFERRPALDLVMEVVWMVANQVTALCHIAFDNETDFWLEFYPLFEEMYLTPLKDHWMHPDKFMTYYPTILGGVDIERQMQILAACISRSFDAASGLDSYKRPPEVDQPFTPKPKKP